MKVKEVEEFKKFKGLAKKNMKTNYGSAIIHYIQFLQELAMIKGLHEKRESY